MTLNIPIIKQEDRVGCGPAVMSSVYKYFGIELSQEEIIEKLGGLTEWGSFTTDHALLAKKLGFEVILYTYNVEYLLPDDYGLSKKDLLRKIDIEIKKEKRKYNRRELESIKEVVKEDIDFEFKIPSLAPIKKFLNKKIPLVLLVNSAILFDGAKNLETGHYIIVTGYEKNKFFYNDVKYGKRNTISADKLLFALSNNVLDSSAYLLVIKPKALSLRL